MFKKSFIIVLIQILGAAAGFLSLYFVAGDMEPEVYSLVGVYGVLSGITLTFTDLGIETTMMREALYWIQKGEKEKVAEYSTQAIVSRMLGLLLVMPFLAVYLRYINVSKYNGEYGWLLLIFLIGSAASSLNDAMSLMVRAQGGYVFSQLIKTINNYFLKFFGIILYFWSGAEIYLIFYGLSSLPLLLIFAIRLRKNFNIKYIKLKETIGKIYTARYLWLKTDFDYFKANVDSLLVSAIFPSSIMGAYTIFKNLENMMRIFIEGFFDVLSQNLVKYKGNIEELKKREKKIKVVRNIIIGIVMMGAAVFMASPSFFIRLVHLERYPYMKEMILCVAVLAIVYLIGKYEINMLALFAGSKMNFKIGIYVFAISVISFGFVLIMPSIYGILTQKFMIYAFTSLISIIFFTKNKMDYYTKVYQ